MGYVAPGASWTTTEDGDSYTPTPDKYMIYRMKKEDGEYYIVGIKDPVKHLWIPPHRRTLCWSLLFGSGINPIQN
ncbi:MAG: hypothetical protein V8Q30_05155 [Acutalibacteraceae bacterium]